MAYGAQSAYSWFFRSDKHEVNIPSLPAGPHPQLFLHRPVKQIPLITFLLSPIHHHPHFSTSSSINSNLSPITAPPWSHLSICVHAALSKHRWKSVYTKRSTHWNEISKREQMGILFRWHLLTSTASLQCLFHPSLLSSHVRQPFQRSSENRELLCALSLLRANCCAIKLL